MLKKLNDSAPLIVIVGPTASGKTALAIKLAQQFDGEIISADSRAVYRYLDIGTAKPSKIEQDDVPHWGIDLVNPNELFTVADFQEYAVAKIAEIRSKGKIPFLVGGTGLYIDSVVFDFNFINKIDYRAVRQKYNKFTLEELIQYCQNNNIILPENWKNRRYIINQIARAGQIGGRRKDIIDNCFIFGIKTDPIELRKRIRLRAKLMFQNGVVEETKRVSEAFGWDSEAMTGLVYPIIRRYLEGVIDLEQAIELLERADLRLVKKQKTWFKRHKQIKWLSLSEAQTKIAQKISSVLE